MHMTPMKNRFMILGVIFALCAGVLLFPFVIYPYYQKKQREDLMASLPARIVARMSLEQKVGQLIHVGMPGSTLNKSIRREIEKHYVGGVILFAKNMSNRAGLEKLNQGMQELAVKTTGIPLFISTDQESGRVKRVGADATVQFPGAMALGQTGREDLARDVGFVTGYELNQVGINLVLSPVLDVNNNPANPVINTRSFGSDVERVTKMGSALAAGIRASGSIPTIKHFPGHGDTNVDSHLALPRISRDPALLEKTELAPFRKAIAEGAEIVMSAHILYKQLDDEYPATLSPKILKDLLRKKMGFKGLIMTDAMEMYAISKRYTRTRAVKQAFRAGADIILLTSLGEISDEMYGALLAGFKSGELSVKDLDRAVERQISLKLRRGLFYKHQAKHPEYDRLSEYFELKRAGFESSYKALNEAYEKKGSSLNRMVSMASVSSLRKPFAGFKKGAKGDFDLRRDVKVFYRSIRVRKEALALGVPAKHVRPLGTPSRLAGLLKKRPAHEAWVVELYQRDRAAWNRLVAKLDAASAKSTAGPLTAAIYSGNPFFKFSVPKAGAFLASYSPTPESLRALIHRALDGKSVPKADLLLPPEK